MINRDKLMDMLIALPDLVPVEVIMQIVELCKADANENKDSY